MDRETYNSIVESIYDASMDADRWRETVIDIGHAFDSPVTGLFIQTKNQEYGGGIFEGLEAGILEHYEREYAPINPWFSTPDLMRPGHIISDRTLDVINNNNKHFINDEYYQSFFKPLDFRHSMGVNLIDSQSNHLSFTFIRPANDGHYSNSEIKSFQSLSCHLMKAVELNAYMDGIRERQSINDALLNKLNLGVFVVGSSGRIEHMNSYARRLIDRNDGILTHHSRLKANDAYSHSLLLRAIKSGFKQKQSSTISVARSAQSELSVTIVPTTYKRSFLGFEQTAMTIFVTDPDDRDIGNTQYLESKWHLAPMEAKFACNLLKGSSVNQTAELLEMTKETARWYSKQVMRKLDVNSQSELIIKLMRDISFIDQS